MALTALRSIQAHLETSRDPPGHDSKWT